jgi:tetratricopeptide (TPR) repeat protein/predicted Ser/Thr protein kinase
MLNAPVEDACPLEEDIAVFVRRGMASPCTPTLEAHVARCSACRRLVSALARAAVAESQPALAPTLPLAPSATEQDLQFGAPFGRYIVLDGLGAGGMGVVYAAYDPELNRRVALKVLHNDSARRADRLPIRDLLLAEAQAMAQLAHPNVVTVFDVGSVDDHVFIAMELVEGQTLAAWLRAGQRKRSEIIAMFLEAGKGLTAAHAAGLIHRDFKPDNVLVGNDGRVRVTDFGLARSVPRKPLEAAAHATTGSDPGASRPQTGLVGTLAYMAPEQYLRRNSDARADQFSFAVALYEALYGERPFASPPLTAEDRVVRPAVVTPQWTRVPVALRQVLSRALSQEPDERYPSMTDLLAALAPKPRRARRIALSAALVVAVAIVLAGAYAIHLRRAAEQRIELVGRLRGLAPELGTLLRGAKMLPLHDIRPARDRVRSAMRDVERQLQARAGQDDRAVIDFVLGEGYRALGDHDSALRLLEAAWGAGERGSQIDVALGYTLGSSYWNRLQQIEDTLPVDKRDVEIRTIEKRYRDPAMTHLRTALAVRASSPAYLEALIAFHEHRFAEASRDARAAFAESPTFYEAGVLDARAHHEAGRALLKAGRTDEATQEFVAARQIFEHVLEIARSDDDAWLGYGEMVYTQAHDLGNRGLPADLRQQAIDALRTVRKVNPDRWEAIVSEMAIYEYEANLAIVGYQDPRPHVNKLLSTANEARAHGADVDRIERLACMAHWEQAVYERKHGIDPLPAFEQAIAACERATAAKPGADNHASLGVLYASLAAYHADHGRDPARFIELSGHNFRDSLGIVDDPVQRYNLGRLWSTLAHYQSNHGRDPRHAVDAALIELDTAARMDATRCDALAAMGDALIARARFEQANGGSAESAIAQARTALDRALAIDAELVPAIKYRSELAELDAEALLERHADPMPAVRAMRADAEAVLRRRPSDGFAHQMACRADILAGRWALGRGEPVDALLTRAASEAARAREANSMDALAWTVSAEVEQLRAEAARSRRATRDAAVAAGLSFIEQAMKIDPGLVRAVTTRDELLRQVPRNSAP